MRRIHPGHETGPTGCTDRLLAQACVNATPARPNRQSSVFLRAGFQRTDGVNLCWSVQYQRMLGRFMLDLSRLGSEFSGQSGQRQDC